MLATSFVLAHLLLAAAPAPGAWILRCDVGAPGTAQADAVRVFRVGPALLQERKSGDDEFGPNLCHSFKCQADRDRLVASLESASVIFTVTFDPKTRRAAWRTQGATGQARTSGGCTAQRDSGG